MSNKGPGACGVCGCNRVCAFIRVCISIGVIFLSMLMFRVFIRVRVCLCGVVDVARVPLFLLSLFLV